MRSDVVSQCSCGDVHAIANIPRLMCVIQCTFSQLACAKLFTSCAPHGPDLQDAFPGEQPLFSLLLGNTYTQPDGRVSEATRAALINEQVQLRHGNIQLCRFRCALSYASSAGRH